MNEAACQWCRVHFLMLGRWASDSGNFFRRTSPADPNGWIAADL